MFGINPWVIVIVGGLFIAGVAGAWLHGKDYGYDKRVLEESSAEIEGVENSVKIETRILRMPKNEVQKLLEEKWCRDCS